MSHWRGRTSRSSVEEGAAPFVASVAFAPAGLLVASAPFFFAGTTCGLSSCAAAIVVASAARCVAATGAGERDDDEWETDDDVCGLSGLATATPLDATAATSNITSDTH